ncbi:MAG: GSCFA domain-containing protein [Bacteroidales bacterium]|jgi:hypothetical protein|nr:GSCFA domain-containing protein [Bacteroidales bacterium]
MNFRTTIDIEDSKFNIEYKSNILFIGSCFSNNIGGKVESARFNTLLNPFGVLYNPVSVKNSLEILMNRDMFNESDVHNYNGLYYSYYHHSSFSGTNKDEVISNINSSIEAGHEFLKNADVLFITFGTARVYELWATGNVVSNCHKQPAKLFNNRLLSVDSIVNDYVGFINNLKRFNPKINIVFTVSPVRHWKDGAVGNQISKSTLILAVNKLVEEFDNVSYFPSYEIVMDDLRDYRFYADDMLHPAEFAVNYIWELFSDRYFSQKTKRDILSVHKLVKASEHRPYNPDTPQHQKFINKSLIQADKLEEDLGIDLSAIKKQLRKYLQS